LRRIVLHFILLCWIRSVEPCPFVPSAFSHSSVFFFGVRSLILALPHPGSRVRRRLARDGGRGRGKGSRARGGRIRQPASRPGGHSAISPSQRVRRAHLRRGGQLDEHPQLVNYPALTDGASRFIDTLTPGIPRVFHPASQRRSHPRASPLRSIGKSPSFFSRSGGTDISFCDAKRFL